MTNDNPKTPTTPIDLRSDTVTRPTLGMRQAMMQAAVGDDVFGDDPSVNALEDRVAELAGKESALLFPSGTQSNLVALLTHCQRGDEYIVGQTYHTYKYEGGGGAVLGGIQPQPLPVQADGTLSLDDIAEAIKPDDFHFARTRLLALENTQWGRVMPEGFLSGAADLAHSEGLSVHLDGARVFNAVVASGQPLHHITRHMDTISLCCSKGLGAPMGSLLVGSAEFIQKARRWRKMVGGGMRQSGIIAAAIDYALTHHIERLADDHERAKQLAQGLAQQQGTDAVIVDTNMVYLDVGTAARGDALQAAMQAKGLMVGGGRMVRLVTHLGLDDDAIMHAVECINGYLHH